MKREKREQIVHRLLTEIEEEDVGISLLSTFSRDRTDLLFFKDHDRLLAL